MIVTPALGGRKQESGIQGHPGLESLMPTNKTRPQKRNQDCSEKSSLALCLPGQSRTHNSVFLGLFRAMQFPAEPRLSTAFHSDA